MLAAYKANRKKIAPMKLLTTKLFVPLVLLKFYRNFIESAIIDFVAPATEYQV